MIKAKDGEVTFIGIKSHADGVLFKQTPNKLFAVQVFNEI